MQYGLSAQKDAIILLRVVLLRKELLAITSDDHSHFFRFNGISIK
jgi:hypothetical protein